MAAHESEHLRKPVDPIELAAVWAGSLNGGHLHDDALNVLGRNEGVAFVAAVLRRLADDLDQAAAAIGAEGFVGEEGEGHGCFYVYASGAMTSRERPT